MSDIYHNSALQTATAWAGGKIAEKLAQGFEIEEVSAEEQQRRIAACESNECRQFGKNRVCGLCNCPMDYKTKLRYNPFQEALGHPKEEVICPYQPPKW